MEEELGLCWNCGGEGCRWCGYTGSELAGERDWFEAAKEEAEMRMMFGER